MEALCCMRVALVQANAVAAINELMRATGPFNKVGRPESAGAFVHKKLEKSGHSVCLQRRGCLSQALLHLLLQLARPDSHRLTCRFSGKTLARGW